MLIWNERRRLQRLGLACGKRPPVVENQHSSLTEPMTKRSCCFYLTHLFAAMQHKSSSNVHDIKYKGLNLNRKLYIVQKCGDYVVIYELNNKSKEREP
ncbi:MAG: hypothetical protein ACE3JN_12480 [Ectobacillus sp.]